MILIGQYDSPFVRRVGIALQIYGISFEHKPWSSFGDAEKIRPYNPLTRVPTLVLDSGEVLIESLAILDYLDRLAGPHRALFPTAEPARYRAMKVSALACGMAEKAVSLFYENRLHTDVSDLWVARCRVQIGGALAELERDRSSRKSRYWFGDTLGHADIACACAWRFISEAHPGVIIASEYPALAGLSQSCEALPVFISISQPFIPPN
jgi:glutathione S-transferase